MEIKVEIKYTFNDILEIKVVCAMYFGYLEAHRL